MASEERILAALDEAPGTCIQVLWDGRLAAVRVDLAAADRELVEDLLAEAWSAKGGYP